MLPSLSSTVVLGLIISALWGSSAVLNKFILSHVHFATLMIVSGIAYTVCFLGLMIFYKDLWMKEVKKITGSILALILLTTVFTAFLPILLYYKLMSSNPSHIVVALTCAAPLFAFALSYYFLQEQITMWSIAGIVLIVAGLICISMNKIS